MTKFIDKTKAFFKEKPVRIILALIIIASIMTGVAFGIIALLNSLKKKWNQPIGSSKRCTNGESQW